MSLDSRLPAFRNLSPAARLDHIGQLLGLSHDDVSLLANAGALPMDIANGMIENVIGTFELPYAVASNFQINGRDVLVPLVVEEPSIVAAASYMAKLARANGGFTTSSSAPLMHAQVQIVGIQDPLNARLSLLRRKDEIIELANRKDQLLNSLGGGCRDIEVHTFADTPRGPMLVAHLIVDVRDAMGANTVNTMAEAVAPLMEAITGGQVRLRILSNLADLRLARAQSADYSAATGNGRIQWRGSDRRHPRRLRLRCGRPLPRGHPQQGHHEWHRPTDRRHWQRLACSGSRRPCVCLPQWSLRLADHLGKGQQRPFGRHPGNADARRPGRRRHQNPSAGATVAAHPRRENSPGAR